MNKIAVIYHSGSGHTSKQALAIAEGADGILINIDQDGNIMMKSGSFWIKLMQ